MDKLIFDDMGISMEDKSKNTAAFKQSNIYTNFYLNVIKRNTLKIIRQEN